MRDCPNCHISMVKVPGGGFYYCKKCGRRIFEVERRADERLPR